MTRYLRIPLILIVSLAIAETGICASLSAGAAASCPVAEAPGNDACCDQESRNEACPEAPAHPTCRMCDDTVAFLLKEKTAGGDAPAPSLAQVPAVALRPAAAIRRATTSLYLSSLSSSPPLHLLNVTFRN